MKKYTISVPLVQIAEFKTTAKEFDILGGTWTAMDSIVFKLYPEYKDRAVTREFKTIDGIQYVIYAIYGAGEPISIED